MKRSDDEIGSRYALADHLVRTGELDKAAEEYVWLWNHMRDTSYRSVRVSFMASEMERLAAHHPKSKKRFTGLRDELTKQIQDEKVDREGLEDWIVLNGLLGDSDMVIEWFDKVKLDPHWAFLLRNDFHIEEVLGAKERWTDIAVRHPEPADELLRSHRLVAMTAAGKVPGDVKGYPDLAADVKGQFQDKAGKLYAVMLAAGRTVDEQAVLRISRELDDSSEVLLSLVRWALKVKQPRAEHALLLDAAEEKGAVKETAALRRDLEKALNAVGG